MSHRLQFTLGDELYVALQAEADRNGASLPEVVRRSVAERLGVLRNDDRRAILRRTAGVWADRTASGVEIQASLRSGLLARAEATHVRSRSRGRKS